MESLNFWIVIGGGAFGGLLHALYLNENKLTLPSLLRNRQIHINAGFMADILLGMGASLAILYFIEPDTLFKQIPLSVISGFGGGAFLGSLANKMTARSEKEKVNELENLVENYHNKLEEIYQELKKKEE